MSSASLHREICPMCGTEQMVERYDSINDYHRELFPQIVDKSIFDYECELCKEKVHAPYPLLFHKMGIRDIQIGYKIKPIQPMFCSLSPMMVAFKKVMEDKGHEFKDVFEYYDDEDEFVKRVAQFCDLKKG